MLKKRGISCFLRANTFPVFQFTRQVHLGFILFIMRGRQHQNLKAQCKDLQVVCNFYLRLENSFTFFYGFLPDARISPISTVTSTGLISGGNLFYDDFILYVYVVSYVNKQCGYVFYRCCNPFRIFYSALWSMR